MRRRHPPPQLLRRLLPRLLPVQEGRAGVGLVGLRHHRPHQQQQQQVHPQSILSAASGQQAVAQAPQSLQQHTRASILPLQPQGEGEAAAVLGLAAAATALVHREGLDVPVDLQH